MAKVLWTQRQDIGPKPRASHAMVYDTARQVVTLFGGDALAGALCRDTWEWDGENWTQVQDIGPSERASHAMAYDSTRNRTVLFGGRTSAGLAGDTWEWDGENWTQVADSGPVARSGHAMAFDSARQQVVLFGGENGTGTRLNDTWAWDGNEWVQLEDTGPSPRVSPAMAFDASRSRIVLFGGADAGPTGLGDTWEWDGTTWTQEADFGPDPCVGGAMAFRGVGVALYGGVRSLAAAMLPIPFGLTWEWDGKHWTALQDMGPGPRVGHAMAFDSNRLRLVLFGGLPVSPGDPQAPSLVTGDTWEQLTPAAPPPPQVTVDLGSLDISPSTISSNATTNVTFTVTLSNPAPGPATVDVMVQGEGPFLGIPVLAGAMSGSADLVIDSGTPPGSYPIIAQSGTSMVGATLTVT